MLSNARCLAEGVDVPSLDGVAFIDPRSSHVDIVQAVGRAIRLSPEKKTGTIVLPVFLKSAVDPVSAIEASNFKPIWEVLDALRAHDDVLAWDLDQIRTEMGRTRGTSISEGDLGKVGISLPSTVDESFGTALRAYLVEQVTVSWNFWFGLLEAYVTENGSAWVSAKHVTQEGYKLGMWVNGQRNSRLNKQLSQERISRLETLPDWVWDAYKEKWEAGFAALIEYVQTHGDAKVPMAYVTPQGFGLGNWISTARRKMSLDQLSPDRISRLESVPGWTWGILEESWDEGFRMLVEYVDKKGDSRVPTSYVTPSGYKLGAWLDRQRSSWLGQKLDQSRALRLSNLPGWSWERKKIAQRQPLEWDDAFGRLVDFAARENHVVVPQYYETADGFRLGYWVKYQRDSQTALPADRRTQLEALPGWKWTVPDSREVLRERGLRELKDFVKREGHARVSVDYKTQDGFRLGGWVQKQRSKVDRLPSNFKAQLEALPEWTWDVLLDRWDEGLNHLVEFAAREGNARVHAGFVAADGYQLGRWAQAQRKLRDKIHTEESEKPNIFFSSRNIGRRNPRLDSEISQERINQLESVPGWVWTLKQDRWEIGFAELLEYVKTYGHSKVPLRYTTPQGFRLGNWVAIARRKKSKNQLTLERAMSLEATPGWAWGIPDEVWDEGLRILKDYMTAGGDSHVPRGFLTSSGFRLGAWTDRQRRLWTDRRLAQDRAKRLDDVPGWSWERHNASDGALNWDDAFSRLLEFAGREGHVVVPRHYETLDGFRLWDWVKAQRKSRGRLSADRKRKMDELPGWKWTVRTPGEVRWESAFQALREFVKDEGHARVAKDFRTQAGFQLGSWVQSQRSEIGRLSLDRKARLELLPGWTWDALSDRWEEGFRHLAEFAEREGHSRVKQDSVTGNGYRLGSWVHNQRTQRLKLPAERRNRLEALPGWSWPNESLEWGDWIHRLKEFARQNGHTRVPQLFKTSDGFLLGRWVNSRRTNRDRLTPDQQSELDSLPGWVWRVA